MSAPPAGAGGQVRSEHRSVALVGRANGGKTSIAMGLTGSAQRPVNFPGSSVERSESSWQDSQGRTLRVIDLPGIASIRPISRDESQATEYLANADCDLLLAVVDASKLSVELHLLRDLLALGRPTLIALNKADLARSQGNPVDPAVLETALGVPVMVTDGFRGRGIDALRERLLGPLPDAPTPTLEFDPDALAREACLGAEPGQHALTERLDRLLLHPLLGPVTLGLVLLATFQLVFVVADPFMGWVEDGQAAVGALIEGWLDPGALRSFLIDGLVNGLGSTLVFLPQIILLIAFVNLLEGSGYLARAAFLLDRMLGKVGLSGRSFVPLASSFACAIPGILATRIIQDERDRLTTIAVAPLMSCSARLPVYVVLIGAFFPGAWAGLVLFAMYALGIVLAVIVALLLRRTVLQGGRSFLLMELPAYQMPSGRVLLSQVWSSCREFLVLAGSIIFATAIVIWAASYYPRPAAIHEQYVQLRAQAADEDARAQLDAAEASAYFEQSYLARAGKAVQPVFAPAGFDWKTTVAILAAFPARELVIPTLGVLHSLEEIDPGEFDTEALASGRTHPGLRDRLRKDSEFTPLIALALMVFFALCSQCAATLGAIRRETRSWRWPLFTFAYMTLSAWIAAVAIYQFGRMLGYAG